MIVQNTLYVEKSHIVKYWVVDLYWPVWLVVLNGGNKNNLYYKISSKAPYHSHGNEILITKKFLYL